MSERMSNQLTMDLICIHPKTGVMRGVNLLRLLVLLGLVSLISGIAILDSDNEEAFSEEPPAEPGADAFEEESTPESNDAPAEADFAPEQPLLEDEDESDRGPLMILFGGGVLSSIFVGSLMFEFMRVLFIVAFLTPLVAKKKHDNERTRGRVLGFIEANAGIHFSALRDGLGLANGVTAYHLQILEKERSILSWRDGKLRRYAVSTIDLSDIDSIKSPLAGTRLAILEVLSQSGAIGLSGKEIRMQLEISRQLLSHHLRALDSNGFIEKTSSSRKALWRISLDGVQALQVVV
ncbi:MAG: hypothetical protein ACPH9J_02590 [Candidatus Poseidoniaceae archaeon]